jgi:hypothetical protein
MFGSGPDIVLMEKIVVTELGYFSRFGILPSTRTGQKQS